MTYDEIRSLPRAEEVQEYDLGTHQIRLVKITQSNKAHLLDAALSTYTGEPCRICGKVISMDDMRDGAVFAGYSADNAARAVHAQCWQKSPSPDGTPNSDWVHR